MNLINFLVVQVLEEKYGFLYELYGEDKQESKKEGFEWLMHKGCVQLCKIRDEGGVRDYIFIHDIDSGEVPYAKGSKGWY